MFQEIRPGAGFETDDFFQEKLGGAAVERLFTPLQLPLFALKKTVIRVGYIIYSTYIYIFFPLLVYFFFNNTLIVVRSIFTLQVNPCKEVLFYPHRPSGQARGHHSVKVLVGY